MNLGVIIYMKKLTSDNFESEMDNTEGLFIIKFFSDSCGPCHTMKPVVDQLERDNTKTSFFEVDTGLYPELASHFEVRGVPYIVFCENREIIYSKVGLTSLRDLQFVLDNSDDRYFREHGEFEKTTEPEDHMFKVVVAGILLIFAALYYFL